MRHFALALLIAGSCLAGVAIPAAAQTARGQVRGVTDPRQFVERTYENYRRQPDTPPADQSFVYSDRLRRLYDSYDAWQRGHDDLVGSIDFDWWTNSQDWGDFRVVQVSERRGGANSRSIIVRFRNFDRTDVSRFDFVRQGPFWYLDDVINGAGRGDNGWTLSALLRERPE